MLKKDEVLKVANLSKLELKKEEIEIFSQQLPKIVEFVERLEGLDTKGVLPFYELQEVDAPMRDDVVQKGLTNEEATKNAPVSEGGFFVVPRVVGTE